MDNPSEHIVYRNKFERDADDFWHTTAVDGLAWCLNHPFICIVVILGVIALYCYKTK
jgi:hypothetical protein